MTRHTVNSMKIETERFVDQKRLLIANYIAQRADVFKSQGSVLATYRTYKGKTTGPYYRLSHRASGVQRSLYLGQDPELAAEVQKRLDDLQAPRREQLALAHAAAVLAAGVARHLKELDGPLEAHGFYRAGLKLHRRRDH